MKGIGRWLEHEGREDKNRDGYDGPIPADCEHRKPLGGTLAEPKHLAGKTLLS